MATPPTERIKVTVDAGSVRVSGNTSAKIDVHIKGVQMPVVSNNIEKPFYKSLWVIVVAPILVSIAAGYVIYKLGWN